MNLTYAVATCQSRMEDGARQAVRSALRHGAQVLMCGRYSATGMLVLRVTKPANWNSESWARQTEVVCTIPAEREAATLAWAQRKMAHQA